MRLLCPNHTNKLELKYSAYVNIHTAATEQTGAQCRTFWKCNDRLQHSSLRRATVSVLVPMEEMKQSMAPDVLTFYHIFRDIKSMKLDIRFFLGGGDSLLKCDAY